MREFADKIAVVTGGGTGMGRELVRQRFLSTENLRNYVKLLLALAS